MTLVIAGYEYSKSMDFSRFSDNPETYEPNMDVEGLFVVADSAITTHQGGRTILNGFRKVHALEAKLWKPYFMPDGAFKSYLEVYETRPYFVGFSGSTLTAQHVINSITEHLSNLRISYVRGNDTGQIQYEVIRHCQSNPLASSGLSLWDNDTFLDRDFKGLLTGKVIASFIEYSINDALRSASSYKLSMEEFQSMQTDLLAGVWCPSRNRHELYIFRMLSKPGEDGVLVAYTEKELLAEHEIAVLGMRTQFESDAQATFANALSSYTAPANIMYQFLNDSIDVVQSSGSKEIDRPASFRRLNRCKITRDK